MPTLIHASAAIPADISRSFRRGEPQLSQNRAPGRSGAAQYGQGKALPAAAGAAPKGCTEALGAGSVDPGGVGVLDMRGSFERSIFYFPNAILKKIPIKRLFYIRSRKAAVYSGKYIPRLSWRAPQYRCT
jgi:hypothetical protein